MTFAKPFYYRVWEINKQCTGLKSKKSMDMFEHDPIQKAEDIIKGYIDSPDLIFKSGKVVYYPLLDKIHCPPMKDFKIAEEYYCTLFHKLIHSTGHNSRLARPGITRDAVAFGDEVYSKGRISGGNGRRHAVRNVRY